MLRLTTVHHEVPNAMADESGHNEHVYVNYLMEDFVSLRL